MEHFGQVGRPADGLQIARREPLHQERDVDPLALVVHRQQVAVELLVGVGVEVFGVEQQGHVVARLGIQQQRAEHGPFRFQVLRGKAIKNLGTHPRGRHRHVQCVRHWPWLGPPCYRNMIPVASGRWLSG